ncbi:MAG: hypothetical protein V3T17_15410 [Pseudomonadales bacterium]
MKELGKLRAYYRGKYHFPVGNIWLPWARNNVKKLLKTQQVEELVRTESDFLIPVNSSIPETRRIQVRGAESFDDRYNEKNTLQCTGATQAGMSMHPIVLEKDDVRR